MRIYEQYEAAKEAVESAYNRSPGIEIPDDDVVVYKSSVPAELQKIAEVVETNRDMGYIGGEEEAMRHYVSVARGLDQVQFEGDSL